MLEEENFKVAVLVVESHSWNPNSEVINERKELK